MIDGVLLQQNYNKVLLRCLEKYDVEHILIGLHDGSTGSHFSGENTAHKVLGAGYYWTIPRIILQVKFLPWAKFRGFNIMSGRIFILNLFFFFAHYLFIQKMEIGL